MDKYLQCLHSNCSFRKNRADIKKEVLFLAASKLILQKKLVFDNIERGILRHSKIKQNPGCLNKWFPSAFEKQQRADTLDYRTDCSLVCGAESYPPVAFYKP